MSSSRISRRYAQALFELTKEGAALQGDLAAVASVIENEEVIALLEAPQYPASLKQQVVIKAAGGNVCGEIERLVSMLIERNKACLLPEIAAIADDLIHQSESELDADVTVATPLDQVTQDKLTKALAVSTGHTVRLAVNEDKSILGGMVIRIGDRKIDYSLRTKLAGMRRVLAS